MSGLALFRIETAKSVCRGQRRLKVKTPVRSSKSEGAHFLIEITAVCLQLAKNPVYKMAELNFIHLQ